MPSLKRFFAVAGVLALQSHAGLAKDRLECILPQGSRIQMHGSCERVYPDSNTCDTQYKTSYIPADGSGPIDLGITGLRRTENSGTPAEMCANFYLVDKAAYLGKGQLDQFRIATNAQLHLLAAPGATSFHDDALEERASTRHDQRTLSNLSYIGFQRLAVFVNTWVIEDALSSWAMGHYADASFYHHPLSHVSQTSSTDEGKSWSPRVITTAAKLITIGKSIVEQPHTAKPGVTNIGSQAVAISKEPEGGKPLALRCRLPDRSEFVLRGKLPGASELKAHHGGKIPTVVEVKKIDYFAQPGAAAVAVEPELAMLLGMPTRAGKAHEDVCDGAGLANGVAYFGATMFDREHQRFTSFPYPDKVWFHNELNREARREMERKNLSYALRAAVTRRYRTILLELPLMQMSKACISAGASKNPACPVAAVLRSESHDNGETWSDLAFSRTSSIFATGKRLGQRPGAARLENPSSSR